MLLSSSVATANVTSDHRHWTDYDVSSGEYWHCMHYAWGISANCYNYYVYLLQHLPTATFTNCYTRWFFSVLWWTRYTAALCCLYARWNQSSDTHQQCYIRWTWYHVTSTPDLIISHLRHIRRTLLLFMDYSAGFGLYPTRGVCGAASKPLTVRCRTPGC